MPTDYPTFAAALRAALDAEGIGIKELAEWSGVSRQTLHAWLDGREPLLSKAAQVARALGVTLESLCPGEPR